MAPETRPRDDREAHAGIRRSESRGTAIYGEKSWTVIEIQPAELSPVPSPKSHLDRSPTVSGHVDTIAAQYTRFSSRRKVLITAILSLASFLAPASSTSILSAIPEVAAEYHSTGTIVNLSNACFMLFMGFSPCFWGPLSQVYGRRWICLICSALFTASSIGTALAPDLASYFVFRMLAAFFGTTFLTVGTAVLGDIYAPTERATALAWFMSGMLIGPALGPFLGGVIVTFRSWRDIFWFQAALAGVATLLVVALLPETIPQKRAEELHGLSRSQRIRQIWRWINPVRIAFLLIEYPNILFAAVASSALLWNMYSLLTPIRYVLNPRFHLSSPMQSGLFYIAPGCGYLVGTVGGGRWADYHVKKWIRQKGRRVPEDRLRSCLTSLGCIIPGCMLVYGWTVERAVGGVAVPVIAMFCQGVAQSFCFPSLNTYCVDVMQSTGRSAEVVASNYIARYLLTATGSAVVLPAIEAIGVGWFSTISAAFLTFSAGLLVLTVMFGEGWRDRVDQNKRAKKLARQKHNSPRSDQSMLSGPQT